MEVLSELKEIGGLLTTTTLYDPLFHTPSEDLYEIYDVLRRDHPAYYNETRAVWCLTRYADVQAAGRDWETFSNSPAVDLDVPNPYGPGNFLALDDPEHKALRSIARPFFEPRAIKQLQGAVARRVEQIMADLRERDEVDLAQDVALRLPAWVIFRLLGTPEEDDDMLARIVHDVEHKEPGADTLSERSALAIAELKAYWANLAEEKLRNPDGKVIARLAAEVEAGSLAEEEVAGMAGILLSAGIGTTYDLIGSLLWLLDENPDIQRSLREDASPQRVSAAIEEALRCESPVQYLARTVRRATTLHGEELSPGERLILVFGAANRDPARWEEPNVFDIDRKPLRNLAFGEGIHFCIGAPLARLEVQALLPMFLRTVESYEIGARRRRQHHLSRGWEQLHATLTFASDSA